MDHHRLVISAALYIQLNHVCPQFGSFTKAGQGIVRGMGGSTAVPNA